MPAKECGRTLRCQSLQYNPWPYLPGSTGPDNWMRRKATEA